MWKVTQHKTPKGQQEIKISMLIKEMATNTYATYTEAFESHFKERIKEIKRSNNFSADLMFKITHRNYQSLEVWKITVDGDFNYKLFQLDFIKDEN